MATITRRSFLATLSAMPFAEYISTFAAKASNRVRHEASSVEGQAMLKVYARAVAAMKTTNESSPLGWLFQWYTHAVRPDTTKAAEITRIYTNPSDPHKLLASDTWDTCEAHFDLRDESYFLPWHRMFVYFFERIVAKVANDDSFALPYWNYSMSGSSHGVLPQPFRDPNNPLFSSLYVKKRNTPSSGDPNTPDVNKGEPIDKADPGALDLAVLGECNYGPSGASSGFNKTLDDTLHGSVHVDIGNQLNMGAIPWAAADPIFWMHHCNVDRLWASWNAGGRTNPADSVFLDRQFVFADENGNRVTSKVKDFLDIASLGYSYADIEPIPKCPTPRFGLAPQAPTTLAVNDTEVALTNAPVRVRLQTAANLVPFGAQINTLPAGQRLFLRLKNLRANIQPGVLYHVYLNLPSDARPEDAAGHRAGFLSFFNFTQMEHRNEADIPQRYVTFEVTEVMKSLESRGFLKEGPSLTIAPSRQPSSDAKPLVGQMDLVHQAA
jgi:tyrosinase